MTAIVATHDPAMLDVADRVIELRDGVVVGDSSSLNGAPDHLFRPGWHGTCTDRGTQEKGAASWPVRHARS